MDLLQKIENYGKEQKRKEEMKELEMLQARERLVDKIDRKVVKYVLQLFEAARKSKIPTAGVGFMWNETENGFGLNGPYLELSNMKFDKRAYVRVNYSETNFGGEYEDYMKLLEKFPARLEYFKNRLEKYLESKIGE